jgi:hypothetical protein
MDQIFKQLSAIISQYKKKKLAIRNQTDLCMSKFNLSKSQRNEVEFGIIIPADRSLQKYADIINRDRKLNRLSDETEQLILNGSLMIIQYAYDIHIGIPGYDLQAFLIDPEENFGEIINLMQGLGGYEHIHCIGEKIVLEIPARRYVQENKKILEYIDRWLSEIEEFNIGC